VAGDAAHRSTSVLFRDTSHVIWVSYFQKFKAHLRDGWLSTSFAISERTANSGIAVATASLTSSAEKVEDATGRQHPSMKPTFAVLVVDTDAAALAGLVELLRGAGYKATGARTFETARQLLETAVFDLLMTDVRLMTHNGLHLVVRSRVLQRAPTAIVLSSAPHTVDETEARRLGASYLARPVDPDTLLAFVSKTLEGAEQSKRASRNWAKWAALAAALVAIVATAASPLLCVAMTASAAALSVYGSLRTASQSNRPGPRSGGEPGDVSLRRLDALDRDRPLADRLRLIATSP
jgi:two-component system OmpR family response regulator